MKKFYSFVFAAVALVGFAACNSDSVDEAAPVQKGETVTFVANIDTTRTGLDKDLKTTWVNGDKVVIGDYTFTYDGSKFSCTAVGVKSLLNTEVTAIYSNKGDGNVDPDAGVAGAVLEAKGTLTQNGTLNFYIKSAFLKYTYTGNSKLVVSLNGAPVSTNTGTDVYVAFMPEEGDNTLAYTLDGVTCKSKDDFAPDAGYIYKMGEITEKVVLLNLDIWGSTGAWYSAHFWNSTTSADIKLTEVSGNLHGCVVPEGMTNVIFCRMNPAYDEFAWNSATETDHVYNQTCDFSIASAPNNYHHIITWGGYGQFKNRSLWASKDLEATNISDWGIVGSATEWEPKYRYGMQTTNEANVVVAYGICIDSTTEFKFVAQDSWSGDTGGSGTPAPSTWNAKGGSNIKIGTAGTYDIYYNTSTGQYKYEVSK